LTSGTTYVSKMEEDLMNQVLNYKLVNFEKKRM
jgi:hypothetical protein